MAASPFVHDWTRPVTKNRLWELSGHDRMLACESSVILIGESGQLLTVRVCWAAMSKFKRLVHVADI